MIGIYPPYVTPLRFLEYLLAAGVGVLVIGLIVIGLLFLRDLLYGASETPDAQP